MTQSFRQFGPDHLAVLIFTFAAIAAIIAFSHRIRNLRDDTVWRGCLAGSVVANEIMGWIYHISRGEWGIPLQLCDIEMFLMAWALLGKSIQVRQLAFFWGLAASPQAIITPDLDGVFLSFPWVQFFLGHVGVVVGAVYIAARYDLALKFCSVVRAWIISNFYLVVAVFFNWIFNANLGYLARKPAHPSLLDWLGPWPFYILSMEAIVAVFFFVCLRIGLLIDAIAQGKPIFLKKDMRD